MRDNGWGTRLRGSLMIGKYVVWIFSLTFQFLFVFLLLFPFVYNVHVVGWWSHWWESCLQEKRRERAWGTFFWLQIHKKIIYFILFLFQFGHSSNIRKSIRLVVDVSGSMYRFNGYDGRLDRTLEAVLMVMEAFEAYHTKFKVLYSEQCIDMW